ncbi:GntR family transcriptional regulator [Mycolicibacterium grossiae]|uniref:GntR family transcriptional regulator n=1 Tax=Mycolicibacterium grossiae TaxID=1552759 RepID=A0A1E8Q5N6_9MYCO|nr:GntR family transcriptional regulator [Mycolicibacterium grossiae]OFJ53561.1 GntR family transcriptional regulator [Mycolicibacterium grossiae]QEM46206.1 GntR family transcriptional regulator [Mycolicibacterium grossiae]
MPPRTAAKRTAPTRGGAARADGTAAARPDFVRPKTAQQAVAEALRQEITTGKLAPGSWIVQETLAERFGMSRIPVREALKTLEAEEYITYVPHSGYRVAKLSLDDLVEVFTLRAILEEALIRDAMPGVTDEIVDEMRSVNAEMDAALTAGDTIAVGVHNRQFHFLTFQQSRMARTKRIVTQLWNTADAYRPLYSPLLDMPRVCDEHELMIEAMAERDVERMVTLNHEHRAHAIDPIHRIFEPESGR